MKKLVIASLTFCLFFSKISKATEWVAISGTIDGVVFYVDADTIRVKNNMINGWIKYQISPSIYTVAYDRFDCVNMRYIITESVTYSNRIMVSSSNNATSWYSIVPESAAEYMWKNMCKLWQYRKQTGNSISRFRVE